VDLLIVSIWANVDRLLGATKKGNQLSRINNYYVVVAPGLEALCAAELKALGLEVTQRHGGGLAFEGGLRELYLANLWLRTASRILVRVGEFGARDFPSLYKQLLRLPWGRFIKPGSPSRCRVSSHRSRLLHSGRIEQTCREAISKALGGVVEDATLAEATIYLRIVDDRCVVSVDSSGEHLHRRGYMQARGAAPLRETLAAGCLLATGFDGSRPLVDLMCGSGTLAVEAALIALNLPPGGRRNFAFMEWPKFRSGLWSQLLDDAQRNGRVEAQAAIVAVDNNPKAIEALQLNLATAGLGEVVTSHCCQMQDFNSELSDGTLICNPPYGERLGKNADLDALYRGLGRVYGDRYARFQGCLICPENRLVKQTGLPFEPLLHFSNGGIPVALLRKKLRRTG
jgi:putative N6-adenine-specific DNA methylase